MGKAICHHDRHITCACGNVKNGFGLKAGQYFDGLFSPTDIGTGREEAIQEIIPERDTIEHFSHLLFFSQGRSGIRNYGVVGEFGHRGKDMELGIGYWALDIK